MLRMTATEYARTIGKKREARVIGKANPTRSLDPYKSNLEREWAAKCSLIFGAYLNQKIVQLEYEPFTLHLLGARYKVDWLVVAGDGSLHCIETKGSHKQKNYRDARSKLRAAAEKFDWMRFYEVRKMKGKFIVEEMRV